MSSGRSRGRALCTPGTRTTHKPPWCRHAPAGPLERSTAQAGHMAGEGAPALPARAQGLYEHTRGEGEDLSENRLRARIARVLGSRTRRFRNGGLRTAELDRTQLHCGS
eukprot:9827872-Alexandrium_andersonii.AAC.1